MRQRLIGTITVILLLAAGFTLGLAQRPVPSPEPPAPPAWCYFFLEADPTPLIALGEKAALLAPDLLRVYRREFDPSVEFPEGHPAHGIRMYHRHEVYAATVLGLLRYEAALPDLLVGIEHCAGRNRHSSDYCSEVLRALGRIGGDRAASAILAYRTYDYDYDAKNEALHMLDFADAAPALQAFDEPVPDAPLNVLMNFNALAEMRARYGPGHGLPEALRESESLAECVASYLQDENPKTRTEAARCLGLFDSEQAFVTLVAALDGDPETRSGAIKGLGVSPNREATGVLVGLLPTAQDAQALAPVRDALVNRGDEEAATALLDFAAQQTQDHLAEAALFALARIPAAPYQPAGGVLSLNFGDEDDLRRPALRMLYLADDPAAWEAFTQEHPAPSIRGAFEIAQAVRNGADGEESMRVLLQDAEEGVRKATGHLYWLYARLFIGASYNEEAFLESFLAGDLPGKDSRLRIEEPTDADIEALIAQVRDTRFWGEPHPGPARTYTLLLDALYRATGRNFGADSYAWYAWWECEKKRRTSESHPEVGP